MANDYAAKEEGGVAGLEGARTPAAAVSATSPAAHPTPISPTAKVLLPENAELLRRFQQELTVTGYSKRTLEMYSMYAKAFLEHSSKPAQSCAREDVVAFLAHMKSERNSTNATLALVHAALKFFFHNFLRLKILDEIKSPKKAKKLPTVLSQDEVRALIKATKHGRNRLMVELLYSSGLRVSELVKMRTADADLHEGIARVKGGKGNKDRVVILSKDWTSGIKKYLKKKKVQSEFLFSKKNGKQLSSDTMQRIIREAAEKAEIKRHVTPHTLRHSFATHLLEAGENIRKIQELLGHSNLNTTQIYTQVSTDELKKVKSPLDSL
ncbi:MAG: site-specific tyrosine recombinase/integron integrase [Candidatus Diapherotrites archaeon]